MDGHSHRQVIQSSVVGLDQCVVLRRPRMLSELMAWHSSSRSVVGAHRVMSQLTECPVCRGSRRRGKDAVTAAGSCLKAENGPVSL